MSSHGEWPETEEWRRLEAPLVALDDQLHAFASANKLAVSKNYHDVPSRSLSWGDNPRCLIQFYPSDRDGSKWNLWLCCSENREGQRFWRKEFVFKDASWAEVSTSPWETLNRSLVTLNIWAASPSELEFATKLSV